MQMSTREQLAINEVAATARWAASAVDRRGVIQPKWASGSSSWVLRGKDTCREELTRPLESQRDQSKRLAKTQGCQGQLLPAYARRLKLEAKQRTQSHNRPTVSL